MSSKALWALGAAMGVLATSIGILAAEAAYVVRTTPILQPPQGPKQGIITRHSPTIQNSTTASATTATTTTTTTTQHHYRLLCIGDSSIQGIGVDSTLDALPHQLALALADTLSAAGEPCTVEWVMIGKTGYRAADMLSLLRHIPLTFTTPPPTPSPSAQPAVTTLVVLGCGVNHIARLHSPRRYERELTTLITAIHSTLPPPSHTPHPTFLIGLPPMSAFPLPPPLRHLLGWKAAQLNASQVALARSVDGVVAVSALELFTAEGLSDVSARWHPSVVSRVRQWYEGRGWTGSGSGSSGGGGSGGVGFPLDASVLFRDMLARDGYHPNAHGASIMAAIAVLPIVDWIRQHRPADTAIHSRL